jgi:hypothetical protein
VKRAFGFSWLAASLLATGMASAEDEHRFKVANETAVTITELQVSPDQKKWERLDIDRGIQPGTTKKLALEASASEASCEQWIRAEFSDGGYTDPSRQDLCEKSSDEPIAFWE